MGDPRWVGDTLGWAAVVSQHARDAPPMLPVSAGEGFVVVEYGPIDVLGCYLPPRLSRRECVAALEAMGEAIQRRFPRPFVVGGVGVPDHQRERPPHPGLGGGTRPGSAEPGSGHSTFVGARGESIVDLTWASPAALHRVKGWRVETDSLGELSDHRLITMELVSTPAEVRKRIRRQEQDKRWVLRKLDTEALEASLLVSTWGEGRLEMGAEAGADW